jgi:hypothetical protein
MSSGERIVSIDETFLCVCAQRVPIQQPVLPMVATLRVAGQAWVVDMETICRAIRVQSAVGLLTRVERAVLMRLSGAPGISHALWTDDETEALLTLGDRGLAELCISRSEVWGEHRFWRVTDAGKAAVEGVQP